MNVLISADADDIVDNYLLFVCWGFGDRNAFYGVPSPGVLKGRGE